MTDSFEGKHAELTVDDAETLCSVARALASPTRVAVLRILGRANMNVRDIANTLNLPMSSAALAVKVLEDAGLIRTEIQPGQRGAMKICSLRMNAVSIALVAAHVAVNGSVIALEMPIGGYSRAGNVKATCGLATEQTFIGEMDNTASFYLPQRFGAQILWFRQGYLEYDFSLLDRKHMTVDFLEISFEACSEAPLYRDPWKSDIAVSVNGHRLGVWTCPNDCGGRHGKLTPGWWGDTSTQYGYLKTWRVDNSGSYLENSKISDITLDALQLENLEPVSVRIEVPEDARHIGGMNLFGEKFGDYAQPIVLRIGYHIKDEQSE